MSITKQQEKPNLEQKWKYSQEQVPNCGAGEGESDTKERKPPNQIQTREELGPNRRQK